MHKKIIQIAGIKNQKEVEILLNNGIDLIGYPLRLPVNKEDITEIDAKDIIRKTDSGKKSVLITYLDIADEIIKFCDYLNVKIVQLHGDISLKQLEKIKKIRPDIQIIKSLVIGEKSTGEIENILHYSYPFVDYFITDTFDTETGASGATGKVHDWQISKEIVELSPKPVILAGGLNPDNVYEAIQIVQPAGVDVHTGVEDKNGYKDITLIEKFIKQANKAFENINYSQEIELPIEGVLDLHTFKPADTKSLINEFITVSLKQNMNEIRIIHGKGTGSLRRTVHSALDKDTRVLSYKTPENLRGGWGATIVYLTGDCKSLNR